MNATAPLEIFHIYGQIKADCCRGCDEPTRAELGSIQGARYTRQIGYEFVSGESFSPGARFCNHDIEWGLRYHVFAEGDLIRHNQSGRVYRVMGMNNQWLMEVG